MLLTLLETAINKYLALDPDTIARLAKLDGKVIEIHISDWRIHFFVLPTQHGVQLLSAYSGPTSATIRGNVNDYMKAMRAGQDTAKIFNTVAIEGDADVGTEMRDIFNAMDIDWEEHLSNVTGDIAAHSMMNQLRSLVRFAQSTRVRLQHQIKDYLYGEAHCFPSKTELNQFYHDVSQLRHDVERLAARVKALSHD